MPNFGTDCRVFVSVWCVWHSLDYNAVGVENSVDKSLCVRVCVCVHKCTLNACCCCCCCGYGFCSFSALIWDFQRELHSLKTELFACSLTLYSPEIRKLKLASRRTFHMQNESHCLWFGRINTPTPTLSPSIRLIYIATKSFWRNEIPNASTSCCNFDELQFFDFSSPAFPLSFLFHTLRIRAFHVRTRSLRCHHSQKACL